MTRPDNEKQRRIRKDIMVINRNTDEAIEIEGLRLLKTADFICMTIWKIIITLMGVGLFWFMFLGILNVFGVISV